MLRRRFGGLALAALASPALAEGDKVSRLVVGFPAGQATDIIARLLAEALKSELGETVIVENKPGQGGSIALGQVARATPDGTTLILAPLASLVINPYLYKNVTYKTLTDFEPVGRVADLPLVMVVNPSLPVKTLAELIAYARANPDKLSHSSSGSGTVSHVAMEELKRRAGIKIVHVPYQGSPQAMNDLIAGNVQVALDTVTVTQPHIRAGRMRLIAVGTQQRMPFFPDMPSIAEQGFPGFEAIAWIAVLVPIKTPAERMKQLSLAVMKVVGRPEMQEKFRAVGALPRPSTAAEFAAFLKGEDQRWSRVITESGIKAD